MIITDFDVILAMNNEWNEENCGNFYVCYADEFGMYKDQIAGNVNNAKAIMKDVFWITEDGKFHTANFEEAEKKMRKNISSKRAKEFLGIED